MRSGNNTSRVSKLATLKSKQANALYWSPNGRFIILAGLKGFNGQLEFYEVDENETVAQTEHFMATEVNWDPSGRYCVTAVTSVHEMENGFNLWSFNRKFLYRILKDHFFQFIWRPRPPSLLTIEKEEEIAKNLKNYSKKYETEDQDVSMLLSEQDREKRKNGRDGLVNGSGCMTRTSWKGRSCAMEKPVMMMWIKSTRLNKWKWKRYWMCHGKLFRLTSIIRYFSLASVARFMW